VAIKCMRLRGPWILTSASGRSEVVSKYPKSTYAKKNRHTWETSSDIPVHASEEHVPLSGNFASNSMCPLSSLGTIEEVCISLRLYGDARRRRVGGERVEDLQADKLPVRVGRLAARPGRFVAVSATLSHGR
jgi:hypothetical protein